MPLDRHALLRRAAAAGVLAGALSGCDSPREGAGSNPLGVDPDAPLEIAASTDGAAAKFAGDVVTPSYHELFPDATVTQSTADDLLAAVQPRFTTGRPPDLINNAGPRMLDAAALAQAGQIQPLTDLYAAPSLDVAGRSVRDTLLPGVAGATPGVLNYTVAVSGLWYSGKLFADNGWTAPTTWAGFTDLLTRMRAKGITPYGYGGAGGAYQQCVVILTSAARIGGPEVLTNIDNLEPGAWTVEPVRQAAAAWAAVGARHTDREFRRLPRADVQLRQNRYQVGLCPAGSGLENEQAATTPPGFEYRVMALPAVTTADRLPATTVHTAAGDPWFVTARGRNPRGGLEYLRHLLSLAGAQAFMRLTRTLTVVAGATDGLVLPPGLSSAARLLTVAAANQVGYRFGSWYPRLDAEARAATNELMFRAGTADGFVTRMQQAADAVRADPAVVKFRR